VQDQLGEVGAANARDLMLRRKIFPLLLT